MIKPLKAPTEVFLGITNLCNSSCRHCNISTIHQSENDLSTQEWLRLIDELARLKVFEVVITGGEPFMRQDIFRILDKIESSPLRMRINTNATLINDSVAERISKYKKLSGVMVSLDGSSPKTHDMLRGKGMFEKTLAGTKSLLKAGVNVSFYCTVTKYNYADIENIAELVYKMGPDKSRQGPCSIKFNFICVHGRDFKAFLDIHPSWEEQEIALDLIRKVKNKYASMIGGTLLQTIEIFEAIEKAHALDSSVPLEANTFLGCKTLLTKCTIRPDGFVTPCDRLWELVGGNIKEEPLQDIWLNSSVFNDFRKRFSATLDAIPECRDCEYKYYCLGGCPVTPYYLYNKLISFDPTACYKVYKQKKGIHDYAPSAVSIK